ncbi:MAG: hypothetical protein WDA11_09585 [Thiohalomonadaceae bacterium]
MIMIKKGLIIFTLFLLWTILATACSETKHEDYQRYTNANEHLWQADSIFFDSEINIVSNMKNGGESFSMQKLVSSKNMNSEELIKEIYEEISLNNEKTNFSAKAQIYYQNEVCYYHDIYNNRLSKTDFEENKMAGYDSQFQMDFKESDIIDIKSSPNETEFKLKDSSVIELVKTANIINPANNINDYAIKDVLFVVKYNNKNQIEKYNLQFSLENNNLTTLYHMIFKVNQVDDVKIVPPDNLDEYKYDKTVSYGYQ